MRTGLAKKSLLSLVLALCLLLLGCARQTGVLNPDATLPPPPEQTSQAQEEIPEPTAEPTPQLLEPTQTPASTPRNYWDDLLFKDVLVYEHNGDTMVDAVIISSYPGTLVGVLEITWSDEEGTVATGRFTDGWGQEVLYLEQGENRVYARADTDMSVTNLAFAINSYGDPLTAVD